jgi:hypothetical protein
VVLAAGDVARCSRKYRAFAYRLVHFDAGVAAAYLHAVAGALGLAVREYADLDLDLPQAFGVGHRWEFPMPTFACGIGPGERRHELAPRRRDDPPPARLEPADYSPQVVPRMMNATLCAVTAPRRRVGGPRGGPPVQLRPLDEVLLARRAVRTFAAEPPHAALLQAVVAAATLAVAARVAAGAPPSFVRPLLLLNADAEDLSRGVYERAGDGTGRLARRAGFGPDLALECTLQAGLAAAPASVVIVADLGAAIDARRARGYCDQAIHAGAGAAAAWLTAASHGLVGTAAGGVIPDGLRRAAGLDGFNECALLAFHFGLPARRLAGA